MSVTAGVDSDALGRELGRTLEAWTRQHPKTSALVLRLEDGTPKALFAFQPDMPLPPASTTKLLTSVAALVTLGTDFRDPVLAAVMRARALAVRAETLACRLRLGRRGAAKPPTAVRGAARGARLHRQLLRMVLAAPRSSRRRRRFDLPLSQYLPSPPLSSLLRLMNVTSDSLIAVCLATDVGVVRDGLAREGAGVEAVAGVLREAALLRDGDRLADACGLSSRTRLSAQTLAGTLAAAAAAAGWGEVLIASLPNGGEGTLRRRLADDDVRQRVRAKTGHLRTGATSLAGIATGASGSRYAFAFLTASGGVSADVVHDELVTLLVRGG